VVAAPMHRGDNFADQSAAGSAMLFSGRNAELRSTIDFILKTWPARIQVDPQRIGAYGMSAGGFTVLTAAGAEPDFTSIASHCKQAPEFICDVLRQVDSPLLMENGAKSGGPFAADARIKAAVIAAPGLGFTLVPDGLAKVQAPIQIWSGDQDVKTPYATNAKLVRDALGSKAEFHQVAGAGHFSFLAPCGLLAPPELCAEKGAFDRKAFHKEMNTSVVRFFNKYLGGS
jgi:predicted dienelactone hydrolase